MAEALPLGASGRHRREGGGVPGATYLCGGDAGHLTLKEKEREAAGALTAGAHGHGEVVRKHTVGDPLLFAVDNEVAPVGRLLGSALQAGDVAAGVGLADGEADDLVAAEALRHDAVPERLGREVDDGGQADGEAAKEAPDHAAAAAARQLIDQDELVEVVKAFGAGPCVLGGPGHAHGAGQQAGLGGLAEDLLGQGLVFIPLDKG